MKSKILILGANGMAGHVVTLGLREETDRYDVKAVARSKSIINPDRLMDLTDINSLRELMFSFKPDAIINCTGLLNNKAEENPSEAILVNSFLPRFLEESTKNSNVKIIHISTDCVFSGRKGGYFENDFQDGIGVYAKTKALGELNNSKDLTIRTSIIGPELNHQGTGLFNWFSNQKGDIKGYTNAFWSGITTMQLMNGIKAILRSDLTGLYHLVSDKKISKNDLLGIFHSRFNSEVIEIIPYDEYYVDKSLINSRRDFNYSVMDYPAMVSEMFEWITAHKEIYPHYKNMIP